MWITGHFISFIYLFPQSYDYGSENARTLPFSTMGLVMVSVRAVERAGGVEL